MQKRSIVDFALVLLCTNLVLAAASGPEQVVPGARAAAPPAGAQQAALQTASARNPAAGNAFPAADITPAARNPASNEETGQPTERSWPRLNPNPGDSCADPIPLTLSPESLPLVDADTTCGHSNDYQDTCLGNYDGGEDILYVVTVTAPITAKIALVGAAGSHLGVAIDTSCPPGATCLAKATGFCCPTISQVSLDPGVYYLMIDTWPAPNCAAYTMTISEAVQGACCLPDGTCVMGGSASCAAQGGVYQGDNTDCGSVTCEPVRPCTSLTPVDFDLGAIGTDPWGYSVSGDCGNGGKWVGQFTAETGAVYHFDLCADEPGSGTANFDVDIKICDAAGTILAGLDGGCGTTHRPNDFVYNALAGGTYFVVLAPYPSYDQHNCTGNDTATFTLNYYNAGVPPAGACCLDDASCIETVPAICAAQYGTFMGDNTLCAEVTCYPCGECPPEAVPELEPCGADTDGGCNATPNAFAPVTCGETICGTAWADTELRDTDWYEYVVTEAAHMSWSVEADFPLVIFIYRATYAGSCAGYPTQLSWLMADACQTATLTVDGYAGEAYWFLALPSNWSDLPCPRYYTATLSCEPLPTGACCLPDGSCAYVPNGQCTAEYGTYYGDGSSCADVVCEPCAPCPEGGVSEQEACGTDTNGGCNSAGFESIVPGETVCGTLWANASLRDTDWYQLVTTTFNAFTWTGEGDIPLLLWVFQGPNCGNPVALGNASATPCQTATITTPCMPPGTYWFWAGPARFVNWPCAKNYVATLTATECPPQYCQAAGNARYEFISKVELEEIDNPSSYTDYSDYTSLVATVPFGTATPLTVTNGNPYPGDKCRAWVDWNHDLIFGPDELVGTAGPGNGPYNIDITPPSNALLGNTRLRIRLWNSNVSAGNPCGTESHGEVEDYTIDLIEVSGACCDNDGSCTQTLPSGCNGYWVGAFTQCAGQDCNGSGYDDLCDIVSGGSQDCDHNWIPDECQVFYDCNQNATPDFCDIATGDSLDCDLNGIPDECEVAPFCNDETAGTPGFPAACSPDCNSNLAPDECDIAASSACTAVVFDAGECNGSGGVRPAVGWNDTGIVDAFQLVPGGNLKFTCFHLEILDFIANPMSAMRLRLYALPTGSIPADLPSFASAVPIYDQTYTINDGSLVITPRAECYSGAPTFNYDAQGPDYVLTPGYYGVLVNFPGYFAVNYWATASNDGYGNGFIWGAAVDVPSDAGVPFAWTMSGASVPDCNGNGQPDECDVPPICAGQDCSPDCNFNLTPDECELAAFDCNGNGRPDDCDIASGSSLDCNTDGVPDECQVPPLCPTCPDCQGDGIPDDCQLAGDDCNSNDIPDECEIAAGTSCDCQADGIPDECQLGSGGDYPLQWDDGSTELAVGLTNGGEIAWITRFTKPSGEPTCHVSAILTGFGTPAYLGGSGASAGQDFRVYVWNDPSGSGDPAQMVFVGEVTAQVEAGAIDTDNPQTVAVDLGVDITDSFFVGASLVHTAGHFPAPMDTDGTPYDQAWYAYSPSVFDPANPGTLYNLTDIGYPCNWLLRTVVDCGAPANDCNENGVPDECDIRPEFGGYCNNPGQPCYPAACASDRNSNGVPDNCETLVGDLNCDGTVGFGDINPFVLYLSNNAAWQAAYPNCPPENGDVNGDGLYPDFGDINPFVALLTGS